MRTNSIGKIRKDLDELSVRHTKLERKLNFVIGTVIIGIAAMAFNLFL